MEVDYFGGCPTCGKNDGHLNVSRTHVFYCLEHRVSWIYGSNIFSDWRDETEAEQREKYRLIEDFADVVPLLPSDPGMKLRQDPFDPDADSYFPEFGDPIPPRLQ
jgi:hypothetical protein